ncbi:HipA domain-containing protein [Marinobacterium lutimaris]|uniref:Serine/threonine-protein kinase HipA n=1 Tax=Marinobacterium lutimaris TaxID=568106 RepID=A0A1H5VNI1_9GAMM|nr:HipA domain-containing protein [Marinobacterium lutimaris]SEF88087.1 serine/threonine-protein kinase HipA [Marinobacterium lutimaris]
MSGGDRSLAVWCNTELVGMLRETNNLWAFEYAQDWSAFDLAPGLPRTEQVIVDGASTRPVQWFFDNLLPEEGARTLLANDAKLDDADAFGLLAHFGAESAGALTLLAPAEHPSTGTRRELSYEELSRRIRYLPDIPLSQGGSKRMSLAGAQHKLPVIYEKGVLYEPGHTMPSTHILKPNHSKPEDYGHTAINEYFMMRLARLCGFDVPAVELIRVPEPVYLVRRFDREEAKGVLSRLHTIDACQLLGIDRIYKYVRGVPGSLASIVDKCRTPASTRAGLFRWLMFNLLIGNTDNHLKNLSFMMRRDGILLAPHYDLLCTAIYEKDNQWLNAPLSWRFEHYVSLGDIDRHYIEVLAGALKISPPMIDRTIRSMVDAVLSSADRLLAEIEQQEYDGITKSGDLHFLRRCRYGVMVDMADRLKGMLPG